jgi:hypothetical protein
MNECVVASASAGAFVPSPRRFARAIRAHHIIHNERRFQWNTYHHNTCAMQLNSYKKCSWDQPMNNGWWKQSTHYIGN